MTMLLPFFYLVLPKCAGPNASECISFGTRAHILTKGFTVKNGKIVKKISFVDIIYTMC